MNYETTVELAQDIKAAIDDYWKLILSKEQMMNKVKLWFENTDNRGLALRGNSFSASFVKVLGKKRLATLKETLKAIDAELYGELN